MVDALTTAQPRQNRGLLVDVVRGVTGHPVPIEIAPRREGDPAALVASSERARRELGWQPAKPTLAEMVADAWAFLRQSPSPI